SLWWRCLSESATVPIGRPIATTSVHVLDRRGQPVPVGVPGELFIGGAGVARGYLTRPELPAERFVADRLSDRPDARLYRTGDVVRVRADGNLEFLGRVDRQVKVRGMRVEPEEVETALAEHPAVVQCAVVARHAGAAGHRLFAYAEAEDGTTVADLRAFLASRLPAHMAPAVIAVVDSLPENSNGKVDRGALPELVPADEGAGASAEPVASPSEATLARIWRDVLGREAIGRHDNFFELGGDSILSIQVIARARAAGLHLTAQGFLAH